MKALSFYFFLSFFSSLSNLYCSSTLYHLIKLRDDLGTSTLFSCQYSPDEWGNQLSDEKECYGKLDGIRRRLTTGFTVLIGKA